MNITRCLCPLRRNVSQNIIRNYKVSASNFESSATAQPQIKEEKFSFEDIKIIERSERRKAPIQPFMKNAYLSDYNRDLLEYPEILNKEEMREMDERVARLDSVFKKEDSTQKERENAVLDAGLLTAPLKLTVGGLAMNVTERIRYLETISSDVVLGKKLSDHWVGLSLLINGLNEDKCSEVLNGFKNTEHKISLCIKETIPSRVSQADFRTTAKCDNQGVWRLNGEKICYSKNDYYIVLALVEGSRIDAFLVTPNSLGVECVEPYIAFRDTPAILLDQVTGETLSTLLGLTRLDTAVICYSILKRTILETVDYIRGKFVGGQPLAQAVTIRARVGQALTSAYAAESMAYFTAGLMDGYHEPDVAMEIAMCRAFTAETCYESLTNLLIVPGLESINTKWTNYFNQYRKLSLQDEMIDNINIFIALNAIQHVGLNIVQEVKQMRNPLFHPSYIMKKMFTDRHQEADNPKLTLQLCEHLHPSLKIPSENLEYCVLRLKFACETLLSRHGKDTTTAHTELQRLAQAGTQVLAMSAVLARASRSYCIGLRNGELEMKLGPCFVEESRKLVQKTINDLVDGEYLNMDHFKIDFGKKVLDARSLLVEKPTERVYW